HPGRALRWEPCPHIAAFTIQKPFSYGVVASRHYRPIGRIARRGDRAMKRILRSAILGIAVAATTISTIPAHADHWRRDRDNGDAVAAGIAGLAIGAIVGGALSQPRYSSRVYADPPY